MAKYRVTNTASGAEVLPGASVQDFRNSPGIFQGVTRGTEYNGTAKVLVDGREYYARVFDLTVETIGE